jgi:glucose-6-phosphate 1-dehydrogenase
MKTKESKDIIFVLFGATGDLALRYIFPALESLYTKGAFSNRSKIIALSRRDWDDQAFLEHIKSKSDFSKLISYSRVDIENGSGLSELSLKIKKLKSEIPEAEVFVYLSLAPKNQYGAIEAIFKNKIINKGSDRLLMEKPFGTDEVSARALDKLLLSKLADNQIYRIDHYLGKDTVRAVMKLHESTKNFSKMMTSENVSSIRIRAVETLGMEGRGESYDHVGAFRDFGQNHILEMLATVVANAGAKKWQKARTEILEHLAPPSKTCENSRRGQYEGYKNEKGVKLNSETETAFQVVTSLSKGKLAGVPLILESGKKMPTQEAFIRIKFNDTEGLPKSMKFSIQPEREIVIDYGGGKIDNFEIGGQNRAYENVLSAALAGDVDEFVGSREIELLWRYADHVVACWNKVPLEIYSDTKPFLVE